MTKLSIISTLILLVLISSLKLNAQTFEWAKSMGGTNSYSSGASITVDNFGNVYTVGKFQDTVDFDPGAGTYNLISVGDFDVFVQKLDASGNFLWAKSIGGINTVTGNSITLDAAGNVYTIGNFKDTVDFDPGTGVYNLTSIGNYDVFVQKMDASGNFIWAKSIGGTNWDRGSSIVVDASGYVYSTGRFRDTVDFDPGAGTNNLIAIGSNDVFILKMDDLGNFIWAKSMGGNSYAYANSIAVDGSGNIYTTGVFQDTVDFDPGVGTSNLISVGDQDVFVQKIDVSGNFLWAKSMGGSGTSSSQGTSITVDNSGNVYTIGAYRETIDFDPGAGTSNLTSIGSNDVFVQKMDALGNFLWAKSMGGISSEIGKSIAVDGSGNIYTAGYFAGTVDFDPGAGTSNLTSVGVNDIFIQKIDGSGNFLWAKSMGGISSNSSGASITVDGSGNIYTTGSFGGTVDFDPGSGNNNLTSIGNDDVFVQKMSQSPTGISDNFINNQVSIYPNPSNGTVSFTEQKNIARIYFIDVMGKTVYTTTNTELIDISQLSSGLYFVKTISKNNSVSVHKLYLQ